MKLAASLVALLMPIAVLASVTEPRSLTFEQRVQAQSAIERVYYSNQVGAKLRFEDAVPTSLLERKVRTYLEQSAALTEFWKTTVTDEMLQRELERMASGSRMPARLLELYSALGNDSFLIKECLARPVLVDRLTRNFYEFDTSMHAAERARAESLHAVLASGSLSPELENPDRSVVDLEAAATMDDSDTAVQLPGRSRLSPTEFQRRRAELPAIAGQVSEIRETREAFAFGVVMNEMASSAHVARYLIPKVSWDAWWAGARTALSAESISAVASDGSALPAPNENSLGGRLDFDPESSCSVDDVWNNGSLAVTHRSGTGRVAVWTGSVLVVWGGWNVSTTGQGSEFLNSGARYDPVTDSWTPTSTVGAPRPRMNATAIWTGNSMVVWGGYTVTNTGGRYDPVSDTWLPTSTVNAPSPRYRHTAVWTGSEMIVWGGREGTSEIPSATGGRYNPLTDAWVPTSPMNAPSSRFNHAAVWSGSSMLVWGGEAADVSTNSGSRYDPATDLWTPLSTVGAPSARSRHTAVWTGSAMLAWGGKSGSTYLNTGGRYDPIADTWSSIATSGAPTTRSDHSAIWTGNRMIVWGGVDGSFPYTTTGGRYDPGTNTWTATSIIGAPTGRVNHNAVWTGQLMLVVAGESNGQVLNTGGRYNPSTDTWTPTATFGDAPDLSGQTSVWTGSLMVSWGGGDSVTGSANNTGARYDPATDSWASTTTLGAPTGRFDHTAVWTGNVMIVWGGGPSGTVGGGRYDPIADQWSPTSTIGDPGSRFQYSAVWTGTSMIIWGGDTGGSDETATGGKYDPATNTWTPTSTTGAPDSRRGHTAVWTGSEMIVWGGSYDNGPFFFRLITGGRYNPASNTWAPTSVVNAPSVRDSHTAVWTGSRMIVWGGTLNNGDNTGGLYDPVSNAWTPTSTTGAPVARHHHTALWTGNLMVVWGGFKPTGEPLNSGGRYNPATTSWSPTSTAGAPLLLNHSAVWTGTMMIIWGGSTGGRYFIGSDCNDGNECTDDLCDPVTGCFHVNNSSACSDGNACTVNDMCSGGACVGAVMACDDGNPCTTDACMDGACHSNAINCDDGLFCNGAETCAATGCQPGLPVICDDGIACTVDSCNEATDSCVYLPNNSACDDGLFCNGTETCTASGCQSGSAIVCNDGVTCTVDSCNEATDSCQSVPQHGACDDGLYCNGVEVCTASGCQSGSAIVCNDGVACTVDSCNEATDSCDYAPHNGACDDGNPCTDEVCTLAGCNLFFNTAPCDDGLSCTIGDVCQSGVCIGATTQPVPKTKGHYKKLCKRNELDALDAACVAATAPITFGDVDTVEEVCDEIDGHDSDLPTHDSDEKHCTKDETELIVLALNICTGRLCSLQPIDSQFSDNTTVQESLDEADQLFGDPNRTKDTCHAGKDLAKEINNGRALRMDTLRMDRVSGSQVRLTWTLPFIGDDQSIVKYEVWRNVRGSETPPIRIYAGTSTSFVDAMDGDFEYEVITEITD